MTTQLHLCILSGQSLPNLLPLCLYRPSRIVLAVSADMQQNVAPFIDTLLRLGLIERPQDVITLPQMPDSDFSQMLIWSRQQIDLVRQCLPDQQIVLNATGGTKLMSQALATACLEQKSAMLYCDTGHDRIEWLSPQPRLEDLPNGLLDSAAILKANGIERDIALSDDIAWRAQVLDRRELTRWLAAEVASSLGSFIPALNHALHELTPEQLPQVATFRQPAKHSAWREALRKLETAGLLQLAEPLTPNAPPEVQIDSPQAMQYLRGGWLEEYLWLCMQDAGLADVHCSLQIHADLGSAEESRLNELDVVVGHRNRVLVVECKTADLLKAGGYYNQMLDKLDSLGKRTGGLLTQCWLVAARWPHHSEAQQNRLRLLARNRNIVLVEPRHLADLPQRIQNWKSSLKLPLN
jgi:hypothetical protein